MRQRPEEHVLYGTRRVYTYDLKDIASDLDKAYWLVESDEEVLKDADKPLVMNPEEAKELIAKALAKVENMSMEESLCYNKLDHLIDKLSDVQQDIGNLTIEAYVTKKDY